MAKELNVVYEAKIECRNPFTNLLMHYVDVEGKRCGVVNIISYDYLCAEAEVSSWVWLGGHKQYLNLFSPYLFDRSVTKPKLPEVLSKRITRATGKIAIIETVSLRSSVRSQINAADILMGIRNACEENFDAVIFPDWKKLICPDELTPAEIRMLIRTQGFFYLDDYALFRPRNAAYGGLSSDACLEASEEIFFRRRQEAIRPFYKTEA